MAEKKYTKKELIDDLKKTSKQVEDVLTIQKYRSYGNYPASTVQRRFNGWNNAKEEADLETLEGSSPREYSDSDIKEKLQEGKTLTKVAEEFDTHITYISEIVRNSDFKVLNTFTETSNEKNFIVSVTKSDLIQAGFDPSNQRVYFDKEVNSNKGEIKLKLTDQRVVDDESRSEAKFNKSSNTNKKNGDTE